MYWQKEFEKWKLSGEIPKTPVTEITREDLGNLGVKLKRYSADKIPDEILCQWWRMSFVQPYITSTSDKDRFTSWSDFDVWIKSKNARREFFALVNDDTALLAFGWLAIGKELNEDCVLDIGVPSEIRKYGVSSALRSYVLRQGLGTELKKEMMRVAKKEYLELHGLWHSTRHTNQALINLNLKLGYQVVGRSRDKKTLYMAIPFSYNPWPED